MSWHFSQALVEAYSEENSLDGEQFAQLNTNHTPQLYSSSDKMMEFCNHSQSGMMCEPLTEGRGWELLMWFLAGFPVKTFQQPAGGLGGEWELKERSQDYGRKCRVLLARYDHNMSSWKIAQRSLFEDSVEFLGTWPRWGMMLNGESFPLEMLAHDTGVKESGLLGSIGTPTKTQASRSPAFITPSKNPFELCPKGFLPHPEWVEKIMGWPTKWTDLQELEMDKFQRWLDLHGEPLQKRD